MPAPSYKALYAFKPQIESAVESVLTAKEITGLYKSRSPEELSTPRVEILFTVGQSGPQRYQLPTGVDGKKNSVPFSWEGILRLVVVSSRILNSNEHEELVASVRFAMNTCGHLFTTDNIPYLQIVDLMEIGTQDVPQSASEQDESTLTYGVRFAIRPDAWPVSPP